MVQDPGGTSLVGIYINPDEIQVALQRSGRLEFAEFGITASPDELRRFFSQSTLIEQAGLRHVVTQLRFADNALAVHGTDVSAYLASVAADFIRRKLIAVRISFTFETVMSARDKVELLQLPRGQGYCTYVYFIETEDPAINISRVRSRVQLGGDDVPDDKNVSRYHRSLHLLMDAIRRTDRTFVFDNSSSQQRWIAEITDGRRLELKVD